jgi:arylsulfatase A-like enzyme
LEERGLLEKYNVIVSADHGFATQKGKMSISKFLMEKGFKQSADSEDVVVAGNAIYVKNSDAAVIRKIVAALQEQPWVGAIFTKPSGKGYAGQVEGTLSFDAVHWNHERSGDILVDYNWDDEVNQFGYKGGSFATGVAGHGGASPHEITIPLIASGPSFKTSFESPLPSSNIDMVPTILHLYGIDRPTSMQGRVLLELLAGTDKLPRAKKETLKTSTKIAGGSYSLVVQRTKVGTQEYVDYAKAVRVTK